MHVATPHTQCDFDALAALVAVKKLYPDAVLVLDGKCERNVQDFIDGQFLDNYQFLKIEEVNFDNVKAVTLVDTRHSSRLHSHLRGYLCNNIQKSAPSSQKKTTLTIFDHHPRRPSDLNPDNLFLKNYGAVTTILVEELQKQIQEKEIVLTVEEATLLALGIYEDTGSLSHRTTTPNDLRAAAWLLEKGARLDIIRRYLSHELTGFQLEILQELRNVAQRYTIQGVPLVVTTWAHDIYIDDCTLIACRLMEQENLTNLFALLSMEGTIYLIIRNKSSEINAAAIAREFGGNGSPDAASATIDDITLIQAQEKLIHILHRHIHPTPAVFEMMSSPAITIPIETTIADAHAILVRYNISAAPVVENISNATDKKEEKCVGIVTRQILERANHHNLDWRPIQDYMSSEFATLDMHGTLADIQEIIIVNQQRIIPVIRNNGNIAGIITRTDLLNRIINDPAYLPHKLHQQEDNTEYNLIGQITKNLQKEMITLLQSIGELAEKSGYNAYVVGGFVRDLILGVPNFDLDIVIEGDGIAFAKQLAAHTSGRYNSHERFKTAVVMLPLEMSKKLQANYESSKDSSFKIDIATARLEYYDSPAAMPTVELSSIKLDLYRRDFTINAMAFQLNPKKFGNFIDYFHSRKDLKKKTIKILHNLSFVEDPSRIFRAIRFEKRMDFNISPHTTRLIENAVAMNLFDKGNDPRFASELKIILNEKNPLPALERLGEFDLYRFLCEDLQPYCRIDRRFRHQLAQAHHTITWHHLLFPKEQCRNWIVYLLTIMSRSPESVLQNFCFRFNEKQKNRDFLLLQKKTAEKTILFLHNNKSVKNSDIFNALHTIDIEGLLYIMAIARKKHVVWAVSHYLMKLRNIKPLLTGKDLIKMGFKPGPQFKKILDKILIARLDGTVNSLEEEKEFINSQQKVDGH